jgi:hypothetical protein
MKIFTLTSRYTRSQAPVPHRGLLLRIAFVVISLMTARIASGDGGAIQYQGDTGPFHVTVFTLPAILNAGPIDITALVQDRATLVPLLDAEVHFDLSSKSEIIQQSGIWSPPACAWMPVPDLNSVAARLNHGENKLLYGVVVQIPHSGLWDLHVKIQRGTNQSFLNTAFNVNPPPPPPLAYWHLFIIPPLGVASFVLYQAARRKRVRIANRPPG